MKTQLPLPQLAELENRTWSPLRDTRHIEDCMMYYGIATRVAGAGEDLAKVRRVFEWAMQQVQLVPAGSLRSQSLGQAFARPYDVLLRGMATEAEGFWAERSWLFMVLCRQLGIDTGLITYTKSNTVESLFPRYGSSIEVEATLLGIKKLPNPPVIWVCTALIDDKAYLFDARLGMEIPGPDGTGVATLDQAVADATILERMNLPGQSPYGTSQASLLGSPDKIGILIDSSQGYFAPKMNLLQNELYGKDHAILYRDPAEQRDHFAKVLGERFGGVGLWRIADRRSRSVSSPTRISSSRSRHRYSCSDPNGPCFTHASNISAVRSTRRSRNISTSVQGNARQVLDKKKTIPSDVQEALDIYATYYLGLAQLDKNNLDQAADMFRMTLKLLPEPGPNQPYYNMFRWGANANLGRYLSLRKEYGNAIAHYSSGIPPFNSSGTSFEPANWSGEIRWRSTRTTAPGSFAPAVSAELPQWPRPSKHGPAAATSRIIQMSGTRSRPEPARSASGGVSHYHPILRKLSVVLIPDIARLTELDSLDREFQRILRLGK